MSKFCIYCGKQIGDDDVFCLYCGKQQPQGDRGLAGSLTDSKEIVPEPFGTQTAASENPVYPSVTDHHFTQDGGAAPDNGERDDGSTKESFFSVLKRKTQERTDGSRLSQRNNAEQVRAGSGVPVNRFIPVFLLFGTAAFSFLRDLFCTVAIVSGQSFLTAKQVSSLGILSGLIGFLCVFAVFFLSDGQNSPAGARALRAGLSVVPIVFVLMLNGFLQKMISGGFKIFSLSAVLFFAALLATAAVYSGIAAMRSGQISPGKHVLQLLKHPWKLLVWLVEEWASLAAATVYYSLISLLHAKASISAIFGSALMASCITALILTHTVRSMSSSADKWNREEYPAEKGFDPKQGIVYAALGVLSLLLFFITGKASRLTWREDFIKQLDDNMFLSTYALSNGIASDAVYYSQQIMDLVDGMEAYGAEDPQRVYNYARKTNDARLWRMYDALSGDISVLEKAVSESPMDVSLKALLLMRYSEMDRGEMTGVQRAWQKEIAFEMAGLSLFECPLPEIPPDKEEAASLASEMKQDYEFIGQFQSDARMILDLQKGKGIGPYEVNKIFDLAERYPENASLQYTAVVAAAAATDDNNKYVSRTQERVAALVSLMEKDSTEAEKYNAIALAAEQMIILRQYREAMEYLNGIPSSTDDDVNHYIDRLKIECLSNLGEGEECFALAEKMIAEGSDDIRVLFYYGEGALKTGQYRQVLKLLEDSAVKLLDRNITGKQLYEEECFFYMFAMYATTSDHTHFTDYEYRFYDSLTEDEKGILSPFVRHYLDALSTRYTATSNIDGKRAQARQEIDAVLEMRPDLVFAKYFKGNMAFEDRDYETAKSCYQACISADPDNVSFLYAAANAYDGLGDYQKAYELSKQVQQILPSVNHDSDWYGIGFHNNNLLSRLEQKLKEG